MLHSSLVALKYFVTLKWNKIFSQSDYICHSGDDVVTCLAIWTFGIFWSLEAGFCLVDLLR